MQTIAPLWLWATFIGIVLVSLFVDFVVVPFLVHRVAHAHHDELALQVRGCQRGYDAASRVAKQALKSRRSIRDVVLAEGLMTEEQLQQAFSVANLLGQR